MWALRGNSALRILKTQERKKLADDFPHFDLDSSIDSGQTWRSVTINADALSQQDRRLPTAAGACKICKDLLMNQHALAPRLECLAMRNRCQECETR
jgi:hypothetical protein